MATGEGEEGLSSDEEGIEGVERDSRRGVLLYCCCRCLLAVTADAVFVVDGGDEDAESLW